MSRPRRAAVVCKDSAQLPAVPAMAQQTLWVLGRTGRPSVRAVLVAYPDAVELDMFCGDELRRRLRFLRDVQPFKYADRVRSRLEARGYAQGRREILDAARRVTLRS